MDLKKKLGKNQVMITALALMIAVAGYLNFAGNKVTDEELVTVVNNTEADDSFQLYSAQENTEDYQVVEEDTSDETSDILSMDSDYDENGIDEYAMEDSFADMDTYEMSESVTDPGEAIFTSSTSVSRLSGARMTKEQMRAQNKNTLLEIINNENVTDTQKQEAVDHMVQMTDISEKETAAQILLEAKGFSDAIVSIEDSGVDVVVDAAELSESERAQIEDIIVRKTGISAENVVISTVSE